MTRALAALVLVAAFGGAARADPVADFYRGKRISMYIRAAPGGNYDVYSRALGRHMSRHIPGNPDITPINMPGGGGLVALSYVVNAAPRDGDALTIITQSFPMDQALGLAKDRRVDMRALNWIGNMSDTNEFVFTARNSPTKTLDDARRRETVIAATGLGSIMTQLAGVYNNLLGTRFRVVYGYPSGPEMSLAMERGEVEARSTSNPQVLGASRDEVAAKYNFLIQTGLRKIPGYEDVPLLDDLASTDREHRVFGFVSKAAVIARPLVAGPATPPERVAALRRAFDETLVDPLFLADAEQLNLEIAPTGGEALRKLVFDLLDAPPDALREVAEAIKLNDSAPAKGARAGGD